MVTAIFAVGSEGQFGYRGKLPWGSFPKELEAYHSALERAFNETPNPRILLVGSSTWDSLPKKAIDRLLSYTKNVWILSSSGYIYSRGGENKTILTQIGQTLPPEWDYHNVVCIGGAYLLNQLFHFGHIDKAYISTISWDKPTVYFEENRTGFLADTWLKPDLKYTTKILMMTGYELKPEINNSLQFKQELHYF